MPEPGQTWAYKDLFRSFERNGARQIRDTVLAHPRNASQSGPVVEVRIYLLLPSPRAGNRPERGVCRRRRRRKAIVSAFVLMVVDLLRSVLHWLLQEVRTFVS